jgi:aminoglycoside phosphotransferase (APT) family kinase protein
MIARMSNPAGPADDALRAVVRSIDPGLCVVASRPLAGGVSAQTTAIDTRNPGGQSQSFVLRQYGPANLAADSRAASHEFRLLTLLRAAGLPVPRPYRADESGAVLDGPWLVIEFIDAQAITEPANPAPGVTSQLAAALASLHRARFGLGDAPWLADIRDSSARKIASRPGTADESLSEPAIRAALAGRWPPPVCNQPRLLHCDFWPGNTLWRDGKLVSVIDWEDAQLGDPLADLGNTRLELAMLCGMKAVAEFTRQYCALMPGLEMSALPYWDLYAALRPAGKMAGWGMPAGQLAAMTQGHQEFTAGILSQLADGRAG